MDMKQPLEVLEVYETAEEIDSCIFYLRGHVDVDLARYHDDSMPDCDAYDPDNVFKRFKILEFPISFVGLSTTQPLDLEIDVTTSNYFKTLHQGSLMKFDEAHAISAPHRAFSINPLNKRTLEVTFKPTNECIAKALKQKKNYNNRFVIDLRLIKVDGVRCCNNEYHSEISRFYISGEYEYCELRHSPKIIDFGDVVMTTKVSRSMRIRNESNFVPAKVNYTKATGYNVYPPNFVIPPNSSKRVVITLNPNSLKITKTLIFQVRNPHHVFDAPTTSTAPLTDTNFLSYPITVQANIIFNGKIKDVVVQSLQTLHEPHPCYAYLDEELIKRNKRIKIADIFFQLSKIRTKKVYKERYSCKTEKCIAELTSIGNRKHNFCQQFIKKSSAPDLFDISFTPFSLDFGRVGVKTYGEKSLIIKNNSKHDMIFKFLEDKYVVYTDNKLKNLTLKLNSEVEVAITILCFGFITGNFKGTFAYSIDNKYFRKHRYTIVVGNPLLHIRERNLKFGMISSEGFITTVPVTIFNNFNIPIDFEWATIGADVPFEIIPTTGTVPKHNCKICDILYNYKIAKSKSFEVDFYSKGDIQKVIPIEINILSRKLSVKFLQPSVIFKDIGLNLNTIERVKLENSSKEIALFYVIEPLIPGMTVEPMQGTIRPKSVMNFNIIVKIACVLEFSYDLLIRINNKENVGIVIAGNVIEPKLNIHPKNIYMPRVPCGLVTYVPVTFQNSGPTRSTVQVLDTGDENIFNVYTQNGNDKQRIHDFIVEGGQAKVVFIKVCDVFRREYDMYIPFKINNLLGPPNQDPWSTELEYYINDYEKLYESNLKAKVKTISKDICYCRITGVITVPWVQFSENKFEIEYDPTGENSIEFTMTNISKYYLHVCILTSKLSPNFSLDLTTEGNESIINDTNMKFELDRTREASFRVTFHPRYEGRFVVVAPLYLDKALSVPYSNLTFIGKRQQPVMTANIDRIIFPPSYVGSELSRYVTLRLEEQQNDLEGFHCSSKEDQNVHVDFISHENIPFGEVLYTLANVKITVCCETTYSRNLKLIFHHECGASCDIIINFCFTYCPLTLHAHSLVTPAENPYPYYPQSTQKDLCTYLDTCTRFLERWMFQQGFRRELYPNIPDTFHAIANSMVSSYKVKGMNITFLNFIKRIAGPLMKHVHKISHNHVEEPLKSIQEVHDTYRQIIHLLRARGANLWLLQAKFLLTYDQFVILYENEPPHNSVDISLAEKLIADVNLFNRLAKQSWLDFILQSYKVFIMDSCFFECVCVSSQPRDIIKILIDWYNEQLLIACPKLFGTDKAIKHITNITTDLKDGIAIIAVIINHCPFLKEHFSIMYELDDQDPRGSIIHNACLIIEAMTLLRLYFPLKSKDFLEPNFLHMLFLTIHLYVTLPMLIPKARIEFSPPLLRSSTRQITINPITPETLSFNHVILNNNKNSFIVEKLHPGDKKMYLSVKYVAKFVARDDAVLLVHGYNKTRIFDTYITFYLIGNIGALNPLRKCKLSAPTYRPNRVDIVVESPFPISATFDVHVTEYEPTIPVEFHETPKIGFYIKRLNLIDKEVVLPGNQKDTIDVVIEQKLVLQLYCFSTQVGTSWIWFRSTIGEFFIRVTTQPRWDLAMEILQAKVSSWPLDPCSCGESCECYRTTIVMVPHRNELMLKSLRQALQEHATEAMMHIYDEMVESTTGQIILTKLLTEGGTNILEVLHILRPENTYSITSRTVMPRLDRVMLRQHTDAVLALPITIPPREKSGKFTITFMSDCGRDIRTYKIQFIETAPPVKFS